MEDIYKTIQSYSEGIFKDRGSKFLAFAYPVSTEEEIKEIQAELRKKYYDARHHCFAYRIGIGEDERYRVNDDGEPSSSAGKPIYGQILSNELTNILVVVVRYFGGTKLGIPGLINAYRSATVDAFQQTKIIEKTVDVILKINFEYAAMNDVMKVLKEEQVEQIEQQFDLKCSITIRVRKGNKEKLLFRLNTIKSVELVF